MAVPAGLVLVALAATGCGGGSSGDEGSGSGASSSGASGPNGKGGGPAASGPDLDPLGGANSGAPDPNDPINTCAGELIEAKYIPLDMYIMLDKSGSMLDPTDGDPQVTKWEAVSSALIDFVSDPESAGIGVGLQVFPLVDPNAPAQCTFDEDCGAQYGVCLSTYCWPPLNGIAEGCILDEHCAGTQVCTYVGECANAPGTLCNRVAGATCSMGRGACVVEPSTCAINADCSLEPYAIPASAIAELPAAEAMLRAVIMGTEPDGLTPSGPALAGAIEHTSAWAQSHPDRQVVAVLATDGLPTLKSGAMGCEVVETQADVDAVAAVAASGRLAQPSISTFAIGVFGASDMGGAAALHDIAQAGGTTQAFIVDTQGDVATQFRDALNQIRGARLACELAIPEPDAGMTLDFNQVNVTFDNGNGPATLFYVEEQSGCDATTGGWYYDKLPSAGTPERIVVCPTTCEQFGQVEMGSVQIQLGCATRTPVK